VLMERIDAKEGEDLGVGMTTCTEVIMLEANLKHRVERRDKLARRKW